MKKFMNIALCAMLFAGCMAFTSCSKSTEDKIYDAVEAVADDAKDAAKDAENAAKDAAKDAESAVKDLLNK